MFVFSAEFKFFEIRVHFLILPIPETTGQGQIRKVPNWERGGQESVDWEGTEQKYKLYNLSQI